MPRRKTKQDSGVIIAPTNDFNKEAEVTDAAETTIGTVSNCQKLNIRKFPNSNAMIMDVLKEGTKVTVDEENSTDGYYAVKYKNISGFCMKQYITIK